MCPCCGRRSIGRRYKCQYCKFSYNGYCYHLLELFDIRQHKLLVNPQMTTRQFNRAIITIVSSSAWLIGRRRRKGKGVQNKYGKPAWRVR